MCKLKYSVNIEYLLNQSPWQAGREQRELQGPMSLNNTLFELFFSISGMILTLCYGSYFSPHYLSPLRVNLSYPSLVLIQLYVTLMRLVFSVKSIRVELHSKTDHLSFSASLLFSLEFIVIFFPPGLFF